MDTKRMMNALLKKPISSAKVVDGKLILSFPHAATPVVWQMDIREAKTAIFEITESGKGKSLSFSLISREKGDEDSVIIASFTTKDDAIEALMATSHALENGEAHIPSPSHAQHSVGTSNTNTQPVHYGGNRPPKRWGRALLTLGGLGLIILLFIAMQSMQLRAPNSVQSYSGDYASSAAASTAAQESGVPVSADDFLRQR